jgi:hypothetical protein
MQDTTTDILTSLQQTLDQLLALAPRVIAAVVVLMVGWVIARLARRATIRMARWMRLDVAAEQIGIEGFLLQGGVKYTAVTLTGGMVYGLILFATLVALLGVLGLTTGGELVDRVILFIPNVIVAVIILTFGTVLARAIGTIIFTYMSNIGNAAAGLIAALARYAILAFVLAMALEQLAIRSEILVSGFQIAFGAVCLALAIAFGLGGREWASRVLDRHLG